MSLPALLYQRFSVVCMLLVAALIIFCLVRAVRGPRVTDRIVAVNMIGTMTIATIAILSDALHESYLLDVCLIYAMISFLAVVVLYKVYMGVYRAHHRAAQKQKSKGEGPCSKH